MTSESTSTTPKKGTLEDRSVREGSTIPKLPSTPPSFSRKAPAEILGCRRFFLYKGRTLPCDSNLARDAEGLRPIMHNVPQAIAELDTYQENKQKLRILAYNETGGLLLAGIAYFASRQIDEPSLARNVRNMGMLVGLSAAISAFIYGQTSLQTNESHLNNAIRYYNAAYPDTPIELQVSTSFFF